MFIGVHVCKQLHMTCEWRTVADMGYLSESSSILFFEMAAFLSEFGIH